MKLPTKQELLLTKIWSETRKLKYNKCVSFEALGRRFQDDSLMALREKGFVVLSTDQDGQAGVELKPQYRDLTFAELKEIIRKL